ncbi:MAG TPA: hypothetical protein DGT21_24860 [Armatimonadetes bacterium]|nr:hypothetical protein [Armatimonadota bacterium]
MNAGVIERLSFRVARLNPCVIVHELRMRMRGGKPFAVLFFYTLLAIVPVLIALGLVVASQSAMYNAPDSRQELGRMAFSVLAFSQLTLILIVMPAYSAGAITMEREKGTLEMLRATLLSPSDVVTGKFLVTLAFAVMLLLTSLPVAAWCIMLGGLAPTEVLLTYSLLLVVSIWTSALGIFLSTLFQKSLGAIVATYICVLLWCAGIPLALAIVESMLYWPGDDAVIGFYTFAVLIVIIGTILAWLVYLLVETLVERLLRRRRQWIAVLAGALAALLVAGLGLGAIVTPAFDALDFEGPEAVFILVPYGALAMVLYADFAEEFINTTTTGTPVTAAQVQLYIWAVAGGFLLLVALFLWVRAIVLFRERD